MEPLLRYGAANQLCILVVEPHADTRYALERYLAADGHHVTAFATRDEALAWLSNHRCDLLFIAIGLDGREWNFIREAKLYPSAFGVALSTGTVDLERIRRPEFGFRDYLLKPFSPDELDAVVAGALRDHAARTPAEVEVADGAPCAA